MGFGTDHRARIEVAPRTVREWVQAMRAPRVLALLLGLCCNALFSSSSCVVVLCSEDCDPCRVDTCKCSTCNHSNANFEVTHRLAAFRVSLTVDASGRVTRIYGEIIGLSLDRALGAPPHEERDMISFARDVLRVNADLFRIDASLARFESVESFGKNRVVMFRDVAAARESPDLGGSASFLFDTRGNLLEIDVQE